MNIVKPSIVELFAKHPITVSLATITEDGKPWVRYVQVILDAKNMEFKFASCLSSKKAKHMAKNHNVHMCCGVVDQNMPQKYFQIVGQMTATTDQHERDALWSKELAAYFKGPTDPNYAVFIIKPTRIELCTADEQKPHIWNV
jgi:general stress protein 26